MAHIMIIRYIMEMNVISMQKTGYLELESN